MKVDAWKLVGNYVLTALLLGFAFYTFAFVKLDLGDLVNGAIISWVTLALNAMYTDQAQTRTARAQEAAYGKGQTNGNSFPQDALSAPLPSGDPTA